MKHLFFPLLSAILLTACYTMPEIPLPEHPRPDFEREGFINLNGPWKITFDAVTAENGINSGDFTSFGEEITVPFPWGSPLSGVEDKGDAAWYGREIKVPFSWKGKRVFVVVGASDWKTTAWIDGKELGTHCGGYTPFEFEITEDVTFGRSQSLCIMADDTYSASHLYGKQGYGNARGIWQTVYLEARGSNYVKSLHFSPDIDASKVDVDVAFDAPAPEGAVLSISFKNAERGPVTADCGGKDAVSLDIPLEKQHLWSLDDPYLYEVTVELRSGDEVIDAVSSYFGQRKISAVTVPGQDYKYVALNGEPIYLKLCLDQSYHPEGFYTFPSDEFMKNEILLSKSLGLNGNRVHIKTEIPRKLYWADKLGLLIMSDIPNFWGEPVPEAREDWERTMRAQVERDFNHPSIFAWVDFNETWGLFTKTDGGSVYLPETQEWVRSMYHLTKSLDPTRLVEDNSACNHDHVETDINSWHEYNAGYKWEAKCALNDDNNRPGSDFNFIGGNCSGDEPMINSECGNVWGYTRSAGDSDYTWDYHEMMNAFHRHPRIGGWLYTEHHDVINEWNGYVRYDRSAKVDGLCDFVPGMSIRDFHSSYYIVQEGGLCTDVQPGQTVPVELYSSFTTSADPGVMRLETRLVGVDAFGREYEGGWESTDVLFRPFSLSNIITKDVVIPVEDGIYTLQMVLKNASDSVLHRNFALYRAKSEVPCPGAVTFAPASYSAQQWSLLETEVLGGRKVNGHGSGYFEYTVNLPENLDGVNGAQIVFEAGAKQLFAKDVDDGDKDLGNYMLGGGTANPCKVSNAYSMTDTRLWPSVVEVSVNGTSVGTFDLPDDPADHRGVLSWHSQLRDGLLREAGSYGYLIRAGIPEPMLKPGESLVIRLSVPEDAAGKTGGGLAIYGRDFGRYPLDPMIVFN